MNRRDFIQFMGRNALLGISLANSTFNLGCTSFNLKNLGGKFPSLPPNNDDHLTLVDGLHSDVVIKWQDKINNQGDFFGFNNDFLATLPGATSDDLFLWANHEYVHPLFVSGFNPEKQLGVRKTKDQVEIEQKNVGGSFVHLQKKENRWTINLNNSNNFRVDGLTPMEIISDRPIMNSKQAIGTTGNCSGGKTPWNTILSCEENFHDFYGTTSYTKKGDGWKRHVMASSSDMAWDDHAPYPPEHYGWVVEVNPATKKAKKLTALGRFAHEGALVLTASDGRSVVYMGDDSANEHFYKFIAKEKGSLDAGDLYVANLSDGVWEHLHISNPKLKGQFVDQTDLLIRTREASKLVHATPMDRPEGCAQDPISKAIFINCTNNKLAQRPFGSILKIIEADNSLLSMKLKYEVFLNGGELTGFACPDNMCFDIQGNLWITTDVSDSELNTAEYKNFQNNSLFFIPLRGEQAGTAFRFAIAPKDAEFTGPCFSEDGKTLFLSIQHPGANSRGLDHLTSHWPDGKDSIPRPAVVAISGPLLDKIISG